NAMSAAMAAEAAAQQDHFWEMHDLLFEHQANWANLPDPKPQFQAFARQLGLNVDQFSKTLAAPEVYQRILEDVTRAQRANLESTPSFFVNGMRVPLPSANPEGLWRLIQQYTGKLSL